MLPSDPACDGENQDLGNQKGNWQVTKLRRKQGKKKNNSACEGYWKFRLDCTKLFIQDKA